MRRVYLKRLQSLPCSRGANVTVLAQFVGVIELDIWKVDFEVWVINNRMVFFYKML